MGRASPFAPIAEWRWSAKEVPEANELGPTPHDRALRQAAPARNGVELPLRTHAAPRAARGNRAALSEVQAGVAAMRVCVMSLWRGFPLPQALQNLGKGPAVR